MADAPALYAVCGHCHSQQLAIENPELVGVNFVEEELGFLMVKHVAPGTNSMCQGGDTCPERLIK
jgi:hypothetical protein